MYRKKLLLKQLRKLNKISLSGDRQVPAFVRNSGLIEEFNMASQKIAMYSEKKYELEEIKNEIENVGVENNFLKCGKDALSSLGFITK